MIITSREIDAIRTALSFALAGEAEPSWGRNAPEHMQSVLDKLTSQSPEALIPVTKGEAKQMREAISQMTDGNARDFAEWRKQTHGTRSQWDALMRGEAKLAEVRT